MQQLPENLKPPSRNVRKCDVEPFKKQKSKLLPFREFIAKSRGQEQTRTAPDHNDQSSHSSRTNPDLRRAKQKAKRHVKIIKDVVRQCRLRDLAEDGSVMGTIEGRLPK